VFFDITNRGNDKHAENYVGIEGGIGKFDACNLKEYIDEDSGYY